MKSLFGRGNDDKLAFLNNKKVEGSKTCKHTLIVLPRISACNAMEKLLSSFIDTDERKIFNIVGGNKITSGELNDELFKLDDKGKKSIILTVNRFLTGVSLPVVDSMIYLKDSHSPQEYDQNIFRLCTRYVKKVKDAKGGEPKYVNMKDNVYLIDFNIANMFTMLNNSARMKAAAEGNPTTERIKELMDQDLKTVPVFAEDAARNEILGKMESITTSDLMKFYTGYNAKKSISEIANDDVEMFMKLFTNERFQRTLSSVNVGLDKSKNTVEDPNNIGTEEIESGTSKSSEKTELEPLPKSVKRKLSKEEKKNIREAKEKFKTIIKTLLYWNLCQDHPYQEMKDIMNAAKENEEIKNSFKAFKIKYEDLVKVYEELPTRYKQAFNDIISKINILHDDTSRKSIDKFVDAVSDLGKIARNEVITPEPVVEKMINKLKKEDFENAETILLVNEKYGEFFKYIAEHFGKTIAKKCRIVPSSEIGVMLTKKLLNSFGLNKYINTIILNIGDVDGNGQYDVKDFLELMKNKEELEKKTGVKRFDICLMNPPYDGTLHLKFLEQMYAICKQGVSIQPAVWVNKANKNRKTFKTIIDKSKGRISEIELIDHREMNDLFGTGNSLQDGGIFVWNEHGDLDLTTFGYKDKIEQSLFKKTNIDSNDEMTLVRANKAYKYVDSKTYKHEPNEVPIYQWHVGVNCYDAVIVPKELYNKKAKLVLIFKNENEATNFKESLKTKFANWFFDNYVVPGDGKILTYMFRMTDYSQPWTDDRFYKYFNLTKEEINRIENR